MKHHARALSLLLLTAMLAACGEAAPAVDTTAADGTNDSGGGHRFRTGERTRHG